MQIIAISNTKEHSARFRRYAYCAHSLQTSVDRGYLTVTWRQDLFHTSGVFSVIIPITQEVVTAISTDPTQFLQNWGTIDNSTVFNLADAPSGVFPAIAIGNTIYVNQDGFVKNM